MRGIVNEWFRFVQRLLTILRKMSIVIHPVSAGRIGKNVSELKLSEYVVPAAIPQRPTGYNLLNHPEHNRQQRILVLDKMMEVEMISQEERDKEARPCI